MKKKLEIVFTLLLFGVLVYTRLTIRALNPLWIDEINEISHLRSLNYLIYGYLPNIPSGVLGHYFLMLPLNTFFPGNKFILGFPGFISSLIVFVLIPKVISSLDTINKKESKIASLVARIGFVFDPRLTFQAMEIRPYSLLPLLWILSVFLVARIISYDDKHHKSLEVKNVVLLTAASVFLWIWHIYAFIMFAVIYFFFILKLKFDKNIINKYYNSFIIVFASLLVFVPLWIYFSGSVTNSNLNTFEFMGNFSKFIDTILNRGYIKGLSWQNFLYSFILLSFFSVIIWSALFKASRYIYQFFKMVFFLVILPILVIFLLDFASQYWFLYRQFAWTMLPFYIAVGVFISGISIKIKKE